MSSGKYIVVFKENVTSDQISQYIKDITDNGGELKERFDTNGGILNGFAAAIPDSFLQNFKSLQADAIDYVEEDKEVSVQPIPGSEPTQC